MGLGSSKKSQEDVGLLDPSAVVSAANIGEDRDSTNSSAATPEERRSWIALWAIGILCLGIVLEFSRFVPGALGHPKASLTPEYVYVEIFDIVCMSPAIGWMLITILIRRMKKLCGSKTTFNRQTKALNEENAPLILLWIFAIGGTVLCIVQAVSFFDSSCSFGWSRGYAVVKVVFIFLQSVFIADSKREGVPFSRTTINGVVLFHVIVCNVVLYIRSFVESKADFHIQHPFNESAGHPTSVPYTMSPALKSNCTAHSEIIEGYEIVSAYASPFLLEFTLTASSMLSELWIETDGQVNTSTNQTNNSATRDVKRAFYPTVLVLMALALEGVVIYLLHLNTGHHERWLYSYRIGMAVIMIIACFAGFLSCAKNDPSEIHSGLDEILLMIAVIGVFAFAAVEFLASFACLRSSNPDDKTNALQADAYFALAENILWVIQASLQIAFVVRALHRQPLKRHTTNLGLLMVLFNGVMWFVDTIHVEGHAKSLYSAATLNRMNEMEDRFLGNAWDYVILTAYPLRIFFRIHSAAMFWRVRNLHKKVPTNQDSTEIN
ncbi:proton channel OTOP2-like [Oscarella lobularis]|uniref:proton channel OTOP2-like n=1 Tax=Oscarella lobularis TaxID=121494 RepID=UPI00331391B5